MKTSTQTIFNPPRRILNNVLAGILLGVMTLTNCISNAALIFSGELAQFLPFGICIALMGGTLVTIIVAFGSAFPFALAGPDSNASALLAIMASSIYASQQPYKSPEAILPTIWLWRDYYYSDPDGGNFIMCPWMVSTRPVDQICSLFRCGRFYGRNRL
jgi:hypothetical protein